MGNAFGFGVPDDVEIHRENWAERFCKSLAGMIVGFVLFVGCIGVLGWNEFNYVRNAAVIMYVKDNANEAACTPDSSNTNKPIYTSCKVAELYDFSKEPNQIFTTFTSDVKSAWMETSSQIYQWKETKDCKTKKTSGGGTKETCVYSYQKDWMSSQQDSSDWHCHKDSSSSANSCRSETGQSNPNADTAIPDELNVKTWAPNNGVTIGTKYGLNSDSLATLTSYRDVNLKQAPNNPQYGNWYYHASGDEVNFEKVPNTDSIGDLKTTFTMSDLKVNDYVSAVAIQGPKPSGWKNGAELQSWDTKKTGSMAVVNWLFTGQLSLEDMIKLKKDENSAVTWALRFIGWLFMFVGLQLITGPIALFPEAIPCVGSCIGEIVGCALCCLNFMLSAAISFVVIGIAWFLARPLYGAIMLGVALLLIGGAIFARSQLKPSARSRGLMEPMAEMA